MSNPTAILPFSSLRQNRWYSFSKEYHPSLLPGKNQMILTVWEGAMPGKATRWHLSCISKSRHSPLGPHCYRVPCLQVTSQEACLKDSGRKSLIPLLAPKDPVPSSFIPEHLFSVVREPYPHRHKKHNCADCSLTVSPISGF